MHDISNVFKHSKVIVFGAGVVGRAVLSKIVYDNYDVSCFLIAVTKKEENVSNILGIPVVSIDELINKTEEYYVVIATMEDKQEQIEAYLKKLNFRNIYHIRDNLFYEWTHSNYFKRYIEPYINMVQELCSDYNLSYDETEKKICEALTLLRKSNTINIARLVVVLGTKCSLQCKECNNLMPHFKHQEDLNIDRVLCSLNSILGKMQTVLKCELIGGEPFLSRNLGDVLDYLIQADNVYQIEITTNGTILPDLKLLPKLKTNKVKIRVSDYGMLVNKERVIDFLERNHINYQVLELGEWVSPGGIEKRGRDEEVLKKYYKRCNSGYYCKTLYDGKLFACARSASLYALKYMKESEFIDLETCEASMIKDFLLKEFSEACDYCDMTCDVPYVVKPAEQIIAEKDLG